LTPAGVELKAERRTPSGEKPCDIEYFLASVGFMPAGPRLTATGAVLRVCFFRLKAAEEKKRLGRIAEFMLVAASYASAGQARR
jgi:hypothetical protein